MDSLANGLQMSKGSHHALASNWKMVTASGGTGPPFTLLRSPTKKGSDLPALHALRSLIVVSKCESSMMVDQNLQE